MSDKAETPAVVFRAVKKRNYRQKQIDNDVGTLPDAPPDPAVKVEPATDPPQQQQQLDDTKPSEEELAISEALRIRNAHKNRLKGVTFRADTSSAQQDGRLKNEEAKAEEEAMGGIVPIEKRFAPQTGIIGELVNKHMEEYIELELAKRHTPNSHPPESANEPDNGAGGGASAAAFGFEASDLKDASGNALPRPRLRRGRITEVDLGEEVRSKNVALTELATRKFVSSEAELDEDGQPSKVKLGKDGKPYRGRDRRDSDAIERDRMVEQLMSENRLDVYDNAALNPPAAEIEGAADDRIAEQFRREFMDAMSQRRRRRAARSSAAKGGAKGAAAKKGADEPILRGPKLGGSRNARAAMRDKLLEQQIAQGGGQQQQQQQRRRR